MEGTVDTFHNFVRVWQVVLKQISSSFEIFFFVLPPFVVSHLRIVRAVVDVLFAFVETLVVAFFVVQVVSPFALSVASR